MEYVEYAHVLEKGDIIIVYEKKNLIDKIISIVTKRKAGHSELYLFDDIIIESSVDGVKIKKLLQYEKGKYDLYVLRLKDRTDEIIENVIRAAVVKAGNHYDYLRLFLLLFEYLFKLKTIDDFTRKAMICSELIATCYKEAGIVLVPDKILAETTPADLLNSILLINIDTTI